MIQVYTMIHMQEGHGYGTEIMTRLLKYSKDLGCSQAMSSTSTSNARMLHIFDKLGFRTRLDVAFFPSSAGLQAVCVCVCVCVCVRVCVRVCVCVCM